MREMWSKKLKNFLVKKKKKTTHGMSMLASLTTKIIYVPKKYLPRRYTKNVVSKYNLKLDRKAL